ncbi:MAG: hypothetical protein R3C44_21340 [Chloroflexota bacterium]
MSSSLEILAIGMAIALVTTPVPLFIGFMTVIKKKEKSMLRWLDQTCEKSPHE